MTGLIRADIKCCLKKPIIYIFLAIPLAVIYIVVSGTSAEDTLKYISSLPLIISMAGGFFFTLSALIAVFGEEFHSGTMQCAIGHGLSRMKLILAKYFDCIIIVVLQNCVMAAFIFVTNAIFGLIISPEDIVRIICMVVFSGIIANIAYLALSCFTIFAFWNATVGFFTAAFLTLFCDALLGFLQEQTKIGFKDSYINSLTATAYNNLASGKFDFGLIAVIIFYIALPLFLTSLIFRRKELEL